VLSSLIAAAERSPKPMLQRINALEERVAQPERMVDVLTQARDQVGNNAADQLRDSVVISSLSVLFISQCRTLSFS